jgi:hypothetical protein
MAETRRWVTPVASATSAWVRPARLRIQVCPVQRFRRRDGLGVPFPPAPGLVARDEQHRVADRVEGEQDPLPSLGPLDPGRSSFGLCSRDPAIRSASGLPRDGPSSISRSIASATSLRVTCSPERSRRNSLPPGTAAPRRRPPRKSGPCRRRRPARGGPPARLTAAAGQRPSGSARVKSWRPARASGRCSSSRSSSGSSPYAWARGSSPGSFGSKESCPERTGASVMPPRSRAIGYGVRRKSPLHDHELTGVGVEGLAVHLDGVQGCSAREVRVELLHV